MKIISIVELQRNPGKALEEVPVLITKHKKKWRLVTGVNVDQSTYNKPVLKPTKVYESNYGAEPKLIKEFLKTQKLCKHGKPMGLCKFGCKE